MTSGQRSQLSPCSSQESISNLTPNPLHPYKCVSLRNIILALHFCLLYNQLLSSFGTTIALLLVIWQLLPARRSLL